MQRGEGRGLPLRYTRAQGLRRRSIADGREGGREGGGQIFSEWQ